MPSLSIRGVLLVSLLLSLLLSLHTVFTYLNAQSVYEACVLDLEKEKKCP